MLSNAGRSPLDLRYLDPEEVRIFRGIDGRVYATIKEELTIISPIFVRTYPLTDPDRYISIRGCVPKPAAEGRGDEFGLLRNWRQLDAESHRLVEEALNRRYVYPRVLHLLSLHDYGGVYVCEIETNRGSREVTLRDTRDNAIYLGANRVLLTDAEGNRYDVEDIAGLDRMSRMYLARIL